MAFPQDDDTRLKQLVAQAEETRVILSGSGEKLQNSLAFGTRLRHSMSENYGLWIGAALTVGWLLSRVPRRGKKVIIQHAGAAEATKQATKKSLLLAAAGLAFQLARPTLQKLLTEQIAGWAEKYSGKDEFAPDRAPRARQG